MFGYITSINHFCCSITQCYGVQRNEKFYKFVQKNFLKICRHKLPSLYLTVFPAAPSCLPHIAIPVYRYIGISVYRWFQYTIYQYNGIPYISTIRQYIGISVYQYINISVRVYRYFRNRTSVY